MGCRRGSRFYSGFMVCAAVGGLLAAGCSRSEQQGGGPGGPGGGMRSGGPGPGGPGGGPVAESASGAEIFQQKCQGCHGGDGKGARGPALTDAAGKSGNDLKKVVHDGKGRMPSFASQLGDAQIDRVVEYVKGLK